MVLKQIFKLCINQQEKKHLQSLRQQLAEETCPYCSHVIICDVCPYDKFQKARESMIDAIDEILAGAEEE